MKKLPALLLAVALLLTAGCAAPSAANTETTPSEIPEATPAPSQEAQVDLITLLYMTREQVTTYFGTGEPVPYVDVSDYNETAYAFFGFPCRYDEMNGILVFYEAVPQAEDAAPYYCTEDPSDPVVCVMLPPDSAPLNVDGAFAALDDQAIKELSDNYGAQIEHVNGLYEYYEIAFVKDDIQYIWRSDYPDMTGSVLYAGVAQPEDESSDNNYATGLTLVVPVLTDNVETVDSRFNDDGTYREELLFDGMVGIVTERVSGVEYSEDAVIAQISGLDGEDISNVSIEQDDAVSEQLSYPAWLVTYETGENEDTRQNVDVYIQTDGWDFRFHTSTPIDAFADYSENIEYWIESLGFFEAD